MKTIPSCAMKFPERLLPCLVILLLFIPCSRAEWPSLPEGSDSEPVLLRGLVYSPLDDPLKLDLYLPKQPRGPVPCVIVIQGGGFMAQTGERFRPIAEFLSKQGFAAALIAYRGRPDHIYVDTIADTKAAVRFIRKISHEHGIDPKRIGAVGGSAGGTLVAMLAVTGGMSEFEGTGGHPEFSSRIQAGVAFAGVYNFLSRFSDLRQMALQNPEEKRIERSGQWIGVPYCAESEHWHKASAVNHVSPDDAPLLLMHAKDDPVVPWFQSQELHAAMNTVGVFNQILLYKDGGHGFWHRDLPETHRLMLAFFQKNLAVD